ncbi:MAG: isoprenylcysteine carboxylmethyltransferase family protein [Candidatus Aenigmatarchaeota archaeon]
MVKGILFKAFFIVLLLLPLLNVPGFYEHFASYLSGNIIREVISQQWHVVLISIALFMAFMIPLSYRRKANWGEYGLAGAFFVSLFIEMYGIPLTILLTSSYFFNPGAQTPGVLTGFEIFGVGFGMDIGMVYGAALIVVGMLLIITGWITLYKNVKKGLVTRGIYSYSRHPQYLGFILMTWGWFVAWPTLITLVFTPILVYKYLDVCRKEENEVSKQFIKYRAYKKSVPFFI